MLPTRINDEVLIATLSQVCGDSMALPRNSLLARLLWCGQQRLKALTEAELEAWCAEEAGLLDALLDIDRTSYFQYRSSALFERYALGLEDGRTLIRWNKPIPRSSAKVNSQDAQS
jgi:hypothetical protein